MSGLVIHLTRVSPTHHRFEIVREDGSREAREMETRSCLFHDLVHFAVETEAELSHSFYGLLASGARYEDLMKQDAKGAQEIAATEFVVGPLSGLLKHDEPTEQFLAMMANVCESLGQRLPAWLTAEFIARVRSRMRALEGEWRATPFGTAMELHFPLEPDAG
jgi:hypothetical protein